MGINGITNSNLYAAMQMARNQFLKQSGASASAAATSPQARSATNASSRDVAGRIANIPDLERYEGAVRRILSGESEPEDPSKPLTEDQIAIRELMRAYQRTDTRSISQVQQDMERGSKSFFEYWQKHGNGAPMPGRLIKPDGSFVIFNSKADKDAYMKQNSESFLRDVLSVLDERKSTQGGRRDSYSGTVSTHGSASSQTRTATEYTKHLQEQFPYLNKSTTMEGVPTAVSVSPTFIAQCANDPEKAKFLEENLAALPDCAKYAVANAMGTVTQITYSIDANGNISGTMSGTNDPDGKLAKANAERKAMEKREKAEIAEEKAEAKREARAEEKHTADKALEIKQLTEKMAAKIAAGVERFEISETYAAPNPTIKTSGNFNSYI